MPPIYYSRRSTTPKIIHDHFQDRSQDFIYASLRRNVKIPPIITPLTELDARNVFASSPPYKDQRLRAPVMLIYYLPPFTCS